MSHALGVGLNVVGGAGTLNTGVATGKRSIAIDKNQRI